MRTAFIILVHKLPAQLHRLLTKLQHPNIDCYVHVDAKCKIEDYAAAFSLPQVYKVAPRAKVIWGGWGIAQGIINCMQATRNSGKTYAYITVLSGQDYPIRTAEQIYTYLTQKADRQYVGLFPDEQLQANISKVTDYHLIDYNIPGKYRLGNLITKLLPARKPPFGLKLYCGSTWWTLTQDCVNYLLDYMQKHPSVVWYFKHTWGNDEYIFHTILKNSQYKDAVTGYDLHYIDWSQKGDHPKVLGLEDMDSMLESDRLFARKFDMEESAPLMDALDHKLNRN